MEWYWIVLITLSAWWLLGVVLIHLNVRIETEELWIMGLWYPILWVLFYPLRAWHTYSQSCYYYAKHNITRLQYLFGKRVHRDTEDE